MDGENERVADDAFYHPQLRQPLCRCSAQREPFGVCLDLAQGWREDGEFDLAQPLVNRGAIPGREIDFDLES